MERIFFKDMIVMMKRKFGQIFDSKIADNVLSHFLFL